MRIAYRLFVALFLGMLAYGMGTAAHGDHPWFVLGPLAVLAGVGAVRYGGK